MSAALLVAAFAAGVALGFAHFASLWWSVVLVRDGRAGLGVAVQGIRFVVLAVALVFITRLGVGPFLAAAAGVIVMRFLLTRRYRRLA